MSICNQKACIAWMLSFVHLCSNAQATDPFLDLALQEVLELEITSVSKKPQTVSRAAAAVFVITGDDIRRSGAQNLPDALRLAPGLQVAQVSANTWAVSDRGPNGRFANKLLVMIDGRTVYSPMFSGVIWAAQDTILADIDRIEVIRGPGASLWGANAVNGVINIITKPTAATQGTLVDVSTGTNSAGQVSMRYGGQLQELGSWRLYGKAFENHAFDLADGLGKGMDGWRQQRLGLRADLNPSASDAVTLQTEIHHGTYGESALLNTKLPPSAQLRGINQANAGGYVLARWQRDLANNNSFTVQSYFDRSSMDWPAHTYFQTDIFDIDMQYHHRAIAGHDFVIGAAFRQSNDATHDSTTGLPANIVPYETFSVDRLRTRMWSVMAQDDIRLIPEKLTLTLGSKFEKYDLEDLKPLPNVRLMWTPEEGQTLWTSASKAIRTPSRIDRNGSVSALLAPDTLINGQTMPRPVFGNMSGNNTAEQLWAYEVGWKQRLGPGFTLDTTAFYNNYSKLRSHRIDMTQVSCLPNYGVPMPPGSPNFAECFLPVPLPNQYFLVPSTLGNELSGHSKGVEVWLDWQVSRQQRWQASLTRYNMTINNNDPSVYSFESPLSSPKWSGNVHWSYTPSKHIETDVIVRHVGSLQDVQFRQFIPSYTALDMRWAWHSTPQMQWSVTGRNILNSRHLEFMSEVADVAHTLIGPSVILGLRVQY